MNEEKRNPDTVSAVPKKEKLTRKEKRARWKAAKRAKKEELRAYYRYAPWPKKLWNLFLKKFLRTVAILLIVIGVIAANMETIFNALVIPGMQAFYNAQKNRPLTEEQKQRIYEFSPLDAEGGARIDALPAVSADDTWTICVYFVAADLEDDGENDLSYVTSALTRDAKRESSEKTQKERLDNLRRYSEELSANGLELPKFFYYPDIPVASSTVVTQDVHVSSRTGMTTADIAEMTSAVWGDNIQIVMQTGGATHWTSNLVNPNRTQRFLYKGGRFSEVADLPLQPATEPETLADFLRFCRDEYPADHSMLVLWDHGGGPFGYGMDSIHGGMLSLKDIRAALGSVYKPNSRKPAFDIIGFDACLMSCLEVTNALDGFADYYCLSEESIPGDGWDYAPWLRDLSDDPAMSPAQLCRRIADSYTDYYMIQNINFPLFEQATTFSVLDAHKAGELYGAYCELAAAQLGDAVQDLGVLAEIGRGGGRATRYGGSNASVFNLVDLGSYADAMLESYPEACSRIKELVHDTVLYHRENGVLSNSTGIAVYIPTEVSDLTGLFYYLDYIYNISGNDSITTLYYYKQAGCLNEELRDYVATLTKAEPLVLDVAPFRQFTKAEPAVSADGFTLPVDERLQSLMTAYALEVGRFDPEKGTVTNYGRDEVLWLDGEGGLCSDFDGTWICLNGEPLYLEVVSSTSSSVEYKSHVKYNGSEAYLLISYDRDSDTCTLGGIREVDDDSVTNVLASTRSTLQPEAGKTIVPLYMRTDSSGSTKSVEGKRIVFSSRTDLKREPLPEGYYLTSAVITDSRGDHYYSAVVGADVSGKGIREWKTDAAFLGRDY